jgi:hypothetical protein
VVAKATYSVAADGSTRLAAEQVPIHFGDVHEGDAGTTPVRYECDCVLTKPRVDVYVVGHAHAPAGRAVRRLDVELSLGSIRKRLRVFGDRVWRGWGWFGYWKSRPRPFVRMPLALDRAFGGTDASHKNPKKHATEMRNPLGRGFRKYRAPKAIIGSPLPNLENPRRPMRGWRSRPDPVFFACVPRGSTQRIRHAGTYDQKWIDDRFPYLPLDFDTRYFQCAPDDQQLAELHGGELVRCVHMTPEREWTFRVPSQTCPMRIVRRKGHEELAPRLDTLVIEPDERRCSLVWRASAPVGGKLHDVLKVIVGETSPGERRALASQKPYFGSIAEVARWRDEIDLEYPR